MVADVTWAESDAAGENLLALHAMGCTCRKANAFSLIRDLGQATCDDIGLVVMSHLCPPKCWQPILKHEQLGGLPPYAGLAFGAVQASCSAAMVIMLSRPHDAIANHVIASSPTQKVSTLRLAPLPFVFHAKACNHSDTTPYRIADGTNHVACFTEGTSSDINCTANSSQQLQLLHIIEVANHSDSRILFLGEWDAELASKCAAHIVAQQSQIPYIVPMQRGVPQARPWTAGGGAWTYTEYFQFLLLKRPYDDEDDVALLTAIMWYRAAGKMWNRPLCVSESVLNALE